MPETRYCPSCGAQVSASERFCGNCGTRMDQPAPVAPTVPLGQQLSGPAQWRPSDQPSPGVPTAFGVPADSSGLPPRRGFPIWAIILVAVGGLCAIGCVATVGILTLLGERVSSVAATVEVGIASTTRPSGQGGGGIVPVPTHSGSTPTEEIPAPTGAAIPTASSGSSGGGIVGGVSTDNPAIRTAEAIAVDAEVAAVIASGSEIFKDDFVNNRNAWFTGVFEEIETDKIEDGVFKVIWAAKGTSYELYEGRELTNFVAEVDCLVREGGAKGGCGIVFAEKADVGYYKFEVFDNYYWLLTVSPDSDPIILTEGDPAGVIRPSDVNRLRVIRQGAQIRIFLNGTLLARVQDSTYEVGKIGISTKSEDVSSQVEVWLDNFVIWELP